MANETHTPTKPKKSILRRVVKGLMVTIATLATIFVAAHFTWKYSGSNKWEKVIDKDGVRIYTLKAPGSPLMRFRGVRRIHTTMDAAVAAMMSTEEQDCKDWIPSCTSVQAVKSWSYQDLTYIHLYRMKHPYPFQTRELLLKTTATQDPVTKAVLVEFMAAPDELPANDCCFRIAHMHNTWRWTPLPNGEAEVQVTMNVDQGLPYFLVNRFAPRGLFGLLRSLPKLMDREKWRQAQIDTIQERY